MAIKWGVVRQRLEEITADDGPDQREQMQDLTECLEGLERTAMDAGGNLQILEIVHKAANGLLQIQQLLSLFRKVPRKNAGETVSGPGGVAEQLSISRNAAFLRIQWVGLTVEDFLSPEATLSSLACKSSVYASLFSKIQIARGNMFVLLGEIEANHSSDL